MNLKRWEVLPLDKERAAQIAENYEIPAFLAMMLDIRGFHRDEDIEELLYSDGILSDPFEMKDMDKAVSRIRKAIEEFEKIAIYGDYDADGVTSTAMLFMYLDTVGADVMHYIPNREGEGYGMNEGAVKTLHEAGVKLIITVDNGISSVAEIDYANSLGMEVVVTDHHRPHDVIPNAYAVVDAYQKDCNSGFKDLCGAGVVLKLIMALEGDEDIVMSEYADLAALATIADIVPVKGENRTIIKAGIDIIKNTQRPGIEALVKSAGVQLDDTLTAKTVAFTLVPRINAVGRMGSPDRAVKLLLSEEPEEAQELAQEVCAENDHRRKIESEITDEVKKAIETDDKLRYDRVLVISGNDWHHGVIGIVAARITEQYGKPCIIISDDGEIAKGSGRSVEGFSLFDAITYCSELMEKFGGHPMAAGVTLKSENVTLFREKINEYAKITADEMPSQKVILDCKLNPATLSADMPGALSALEPFGADNREPLYGLYGMTVKEVVSLSGGVHTKLICTRANSAVSCLKFGIGPDKFPYTVGDIVDLAVSMDSKVYKGQKQLTIIIKDIKLSSCDDSAMLHSYRLYEKYKRSELITRDSAVSITPNRTQLGVLYKKLALSKGGSYNILKLETELRASGFNISRLILGLEILAERGLIECEMSDEIATVGISKTNGEKQNIYDSAIFANIKSLIMKETLL